MSPSWTFCAIRLLESSILVHSSSNTKKTLLPCLVYTFCYEHNVASYETTTFSDKCARRMVKNTSPLHSSASPLTPVQPKKIKIRLLGNVGTFPWHSVQCCVSDGRMQFCSFLRCKKCNLHFMIIKWDYCTAVPESSWINKEKRFIYIRIRSVAIAMHLKSMHCNCYALKSDALQSPITI